MRTIQSELERIKEFLEEQIKLNKFKMARETEDGDIELVSPKVTIGNLPHNNFSMYGADERFFQAPYFLVGFETAGYDNDEEYINILIQACAYTSGQYESDDEENSFPDNMGMLDVTSMLETIKGWMIKDAKFPISRPFKIGSYSSQELTYPYAFGYLSFELNTTEGVMHQPKFFDFA